MENVLSVFWVTFEQAILSALTTLALGFVGAQGLLSLYSRHLNRKIIEFIILFPNMMPALFVVLGCLTFVRPFPFGLVGVVFVHTVMNVGLVAVTLLNLLESKMGGMIELAWIEGATRTQFIRKSFGFLKKDIGYLFLFVFAISFSSFSVPLLIGGVTTVELFIYQKIRVWGSWSEALTLSIIQMFFIFLFSLLLSQQKIEKSGRFYRLDLLALPIAWFIPFFLALMVLIGPLISLNLADLSWKYIKSSAFFGTLWVGLGVGGLTLFFLLLTAFSFPTRFLEKFMTGYITPSSVLTGFALLLIGPQGGLWSLSKIVLGFSLITFPALYRMGWGSQLDSLKGQILITQTMGASWGLTFKKILFPQLIEKGGFLSGIAAFWACGDFALSTILAGGDKTLALIVQNLIGSYRLDMATLLMFILLICGIFCLVLFWGLGYVTSRKSHL